MIAQQWMNRLYYDDLQLQHQQDNVSGSPHHYGHVVPCPMTFVPLNPMKANYPERVSDYNPMCYYVPVMQKDAQWSKGTRDSKEQGRANDSLLFNILESKSSCRDTFPARQSNASQSKFSQLVNEVKVCQMASDILIKTVNFVKNLTVFRTLSFDDQMRLFRRSWAELFIIGLAQHEVIFQTNPCNVSTGMHAGNHFALTSEIKKILSFIERCSKLNITENEYAYFKGIVLFNPDMPNLSNRSTIASLQDEAQHALMNYTFADKSELGSDGEDADDIGREFHVRRQIRVAQILLSLPALRSVNNQVIVNFFFRHISQSTADIENMLVEHLIQ